MGIIRALLVPIFAAVAVGQGTPPLDAFHVSTAAPVHVSNIAPGRSYVIRLDGEIVTCDPSYGLYVRSERKGAPMVFQYVLPGAGVIRSTKEVPLTVACLKVDTGYGRP